MQFKYKSRNKKYPYKLRTILVLFNNLEYFIIWHMCGPVGAILEEFYCTYLFPYHFCREVICLLNLYQPCTAVLQTYLCVIQLAASQTFTLLTLLVTWVKMWLPATINRRLEISIRLCEAWLNVYKNTLCWNVAAHSLLYRAFHNVLRDYKHV